MPRLDPIRILETLKDHGVRFILIGGSAANARGSPSVTGDVDICYARDEDNFGRLASALTALRARLRGVPEDVPFLLDGKTIKMGDHLTFTTDAGDFDCIGTPAGVAGFDELDRNATDEDFDGLTVRVASIDDLIRMKRAGGRPKDRVELEILGALREEIEAREAERKDD